VKVTSDSFTAHLHAAILRAACTGRPGRARPARPAAPQRQLFALRHAEEDGAIGVWASPSKSRSQMLPIRLPILSRWPHLVALDAVDRRAESGGHEEDAEHQAPATASISPRRRAPAPAAPAPRSRSTLRRRGRRPGARCPPSSPSLPDNLGARTAAGRHQVISDIRITRTESLPNTYSTAKRAAPGRARARCWPGRRHLPGPMKAQKQRQHALPRAPT